MPFRPVHTIAQVVDRRMPVLEPLVIVAAASLLTSLGIQPYVAHALAQQGAAAQGAAQAALWLSGILAPLTAFAKALAAALVCWSCGVFLGVRLPFLKLLSVFCVTELVFSLRDAALLGVLAARGMGSIRATGDLMVAFGANAFVRSPSPAQRIGLESWDAFTVAWGVLTFALIRTVFKTDRAAAAYLAAASVAFRTLFSAASLLYSL